MIADDHPTPRKALRIVRDHQGKPDRESG